MIKYVNYLNDKKSLFKFSKEYSDEESCIFQLISNKKNDFLNFFSDFFMDLPGFMAIYKDKFFSRIKDFIDDKNYIFALKDKFNKKCSETKTSEKDSEKNDFLGLKRKRNKDSIVTDYDTELKLLENDYPQIIDNGDEFNFENVQIKKEKIDDDEIINNEINIDNNINTSKETQNKLENLSKNKSKNPKTTKLISKKNIQKKINTLSQNASRKIKEKERNLKLEQFYFNKILTPTKTSFNFNNIINNVIDGSIYSADFALNNIKAKSPNKIQRSYGINSRLDKMPKINIYKKKKHLTNYSAERLLYNIKDKLISIGQKNNYYRKKRYLSDDRKKMDEMQNLSQIVNNNFYGKERLESPLCIRHDEKGVKLANDENFININGENDLNNVNNPKKKKKLIKSKYISESPPKVKYNKNVSVLYKIILSYKKRKSERIITKSEFMPDSIIIDKSAISINEIKLLFDSVFKKEKKDRKDKRNITNTKDKTQKKINNKIRTKKNPKEKIQKSTHLIKPRKSKRIEQLQKVKQQIEKEIQALEYFQNLRRRKSKRFIRKKKKIKPKKALVNKEKEENKIPENKSIRFDSLGQNSIANMGKIRTNCEDYINNDDNDKTKNDPNEILVNKTICLDHQPDEERFSSNRRKGKLKNFINNSIISDNLDDFDALKGFNYLYNQKK